MVEPPHQPRQAIKLFMLALVLASAEIQNRACGFHTESVHPIGRGSPGHGGPERCAFGIETPSGLRIAYGECDALGELLIISLAPFLGSWLTWAAECRAFFHPLARASDGLGGRGRGRERGSLHGRFHSRRRERH